jgi:AraC-like DNA-binding protein
VQIDPLRSDGDMLTFKLKAAGNDVTHKIYSGVTREFFGTDAVVAKANEAQDSPCPSFRNTVGTAPPILITRGEAHVLRSGRDTKTIALLDLDRRPAHLGAIRHGGNGGPISTLICGYFTLARPTRNNVLEMLPPIVHLRPDHGWLEAILQRIVIESAVQRPGQCAVLARITEMLFVEVLRSWTTSRERGEGGWLAALADSQIGKALQLIHDQPARPWSLRELAQSAGLGRSVFAARFTGLVGQSAHRYLVSRRMEDAALLLESGNDAIAEIAARVGYATTAAFSKVFQRHYGISPGRYRSRNVKVNTLDEQTGG